MNSVNKLMEYARELGACAQSGKVTDYKSLVWMFFSPQGREFCGQNNFPTLDMFRLIKNEVEEYGVIVDGGTIERCNEANIGIVGETDACLIYTDNTLVHKVVLMHGAKAHIKASNYAVILLLNIAGSEVEIEKDETVVIL